MSGRVGSITTEIIADGLVFNMDPANRACYPRTGTTATDTVGNIAGTLSGASGDNNTPQWENTNGGVFDFDGSDDYINVNYNSIFSQGEYSISFWINNDFNSGVVNKGILCADSSTRGWALLQENQLLKWNANILGSNAQLDTSNFFNTTGTWINCSITFNGSALIIYKNGLNVNDSSSGDRNMNANNNPLTIGNNTFASGRFFNGQIGPVHIYNRALSAIEVMKNFNALKDRMGYVAPLLLDTYTGATAAYSLRRLSNNYTGNLIRVAKKVSNVESETDIGYNSSNELDTTALAAFASGADGGDVRVVTWYDQSGNSNNVSQSTYVSCPKIYDDGSLQVSNGKPAIKTGGNQWLQTDNQPLSSTQQSGFFVGEPITIGSFDSIFGHGDYRAYFYFANPQIGLQMISVSGAAVSNVGNFAVGNQALLSYYNNSSTLFLRQDGTQLGTDSVTPASYGSKDVFVGHFSGGNVNKIFKGYNQEHIIFPSDQSSNISEIETNINTYHGIY